MTIGGRHGDADARSDHELMVADVVGRAERLDDSLRQHGQVVRLTHGQHNCKLVSPKAGDKGVVTHARAQPIRDSDQQPVPDRVAKHIVHGLETIQVKVDNGELFAPARSLERLLGL